MSLFSLKDLPEKLPLPARPAVIKYIGFMLFCFVIGLLAIKLFFAEEILSLYTYFAFVFMVVVLLALFVRFRVYEGQTDYVLQWNKAVAHERENVI